MSVQITIGVCLRNCENIVKNIIARISNQAFLSKKMEVIFVDDGSMDNTLFEILKYAPKMNIKYSIYHHEWKGLGFSRNIILNNAQGKYILWIDDGTIVHKDYIKKQIEFMEKNQEVGISRGIISTYSGSNSIATLENMIELVFNHKYKEKFISKLPGTAASIYRVESAKCVGGFDERIFGAMEDIDIAYRILKAGWKIYISNAKFYISFNYNFKNIWDKSIWYGYGLHFISHKHKKLHYIVYKSTPLAGFLEGIMNSFIAYKLTQKKLAFFLPIYLFIKRVAWCLGYIKGHIDSYGHNLKTVSL